MANNNDTLRLLVLKGFSKTGERVNKHLASLRNKSEDEGDFILDIENPRFNNGEAKVTINESVRCKDVYILVDIGNYECSYMMFGYRNVYSPDEHFQDLKRSISAIKNTADRVTVIMPLLYASRQHKRKSRESLDCAMALQELETLGVKNIITFDAHDPNVQNAIPNLSFENFYASNVIIETFIQENEINLNKSLVISPDTGAMDRALYYANILGVDVGMFYKRRDVSKVIDGKNPVVAHEYMGKDIQDLDVIVVDDMIASGDSMIEVSEKLKEMGANNVYILATFTLFTEGTKRFQEAYDKGLFKKIYTTNLSYIPKDVEKNEWFGIVDCSEFIANIIDTLNNEKSISPLLKGNEKLIALMSEKKK